MRGVRLSAGGRVQVRDDLPSPEPRAGWTRVRVSRAGICATDLALARGYMSFAGTPGHEFVGTALDGPFAGARVVGEINAGCGTCPSCREQQGRHCPTRTVLGILNHPGAFAEELALPTRNLHRVPDAVSDTAAVFVEPLAAAFEIAEQVALEPGMRALVAGDGKLGLMCAHVLALAGLDVTVAGRHAERARLLPERARHRLGMLEPAPSEAPPGARFDLAVEATGKGESLERLVPLVRPRGTIVLKTTCEASVPLNLSRAVVDELTLVGSRCGPFVPALEALARGAVPVESMVAGTFALGDAERAFAAARAPGALKIQLACG